jgi:hypothetical protein
MPTGLRLFVSSVRRGLEEERDVLPPLIRALGHSPLRFEDYTAQPMPPREACLRGVEDADVYVLLLGEKYGEPIFDTGLAPTEEEFNVARRRGMPVLVFVKEGADPEPRQAEFISRVEEYTAGRFRRSFGSAADLQTKLVEAVRLVEEERAPLTWTPLDQTIEVSWIVDPEAARTSSRGAILELHVLPLAAERLAATVLDALPARIAEAGRQFGFFDPGEGLDLASDAQTAAVRTQRERRREERGIRITRAAAASLWIELPRDTLGHILDTADVRTRITGGLRMAASLLSRTSERTALAAGIGPIGFVVEGSVADLGRRSSASIGMPSEQIVHVEPEDAVPTASLNEAADEIAGELTARLMQRFRSIRR